MFGMSRIVALLGVIVAGVSTVFAARVPSWLPEDFRFAVPSNEAAEVEQTLALMRDALHPKLIEMMWSADPTTNNQPLTTNHYPTMLGPTLQWIVHVSQPGKADEAGYFETFKPNYQLAFDRTILTNRASRLSILPPRVRLSLVYDDIAKDGVSRAIPGVDYPGVSYEDEGSTPDRITIVHRAPKMNRHFKLKVEALMAGAAEYEYRHFVLSSYAAVYGMPRDAVKERCIYPNLYFDYAHISRQGLLVAIYARAKGGLWSLPSYIYACPDELCKHKYDARGIIESIDYGGYVDFYQVDEKGRIIGFTRKEKGNLGGVRFSCLGEVVLEAYPNDLPKISHKVRYFISDGKLMYEELKDDVFYKLGEMEVKNAKW